MQEILLIIQIIICVFLVLLVLVQQGKGATMGAAFGTGASSTVFGSKGSGSFLLKITGLVAILFFANSLALGYLASSEARLSKHNALVSMPAAPQVAPQKVQTAPVKKPAKTEKK